MNLKNLLPLALLVLFSMGCDKEELQESGAVSFMDPALDQGISLKLTYPDGSTKTITGNRVLGWHKGQLLNGDHFRSLNGGGNGPRFDLRFSFPKAVKAADVIAGNHTFRTTRLRLEDTGNLDQTQVEFWLDSVEGNGEFDPYTNVTGTLAFKEDFKAFDQTYAIVADIDGEVINRKGEKVTIKGGFWSKKLLIKI
ncbi:hypothetical protein [Maribacter sp. 2307ULW6-5]|uniref:hypothetical protein n=1 Tax=Maribacter sp. 2307ULW6-5 TaxID=3386275 RepID=UPI0039BD6466